ncbi:MAG TPA: hypothetical protein VKE74_31490, partial [Gemmataceae bacterium]|nr:hypothetical protein [Gemmataceae bacterium]
MFALRTLLIRLMVAFGVIPADSRATSPDVSRRRRAALSVCVGLMVVAAFQVGLGWAVDTERLPLRDPIYFDKLAAFHIHPAFFSPSPRPADKPLTVLFVGSSRTLNAINAGAAGEELTRHLGRPVEAFNFGQAGAGPVTNAVYVRRLMQDGVKADFVLIEVHPVFLAGQRPDPPETRWLLPIRLRRDELPVVRAMGFPASDPTVHGPRGLVAPWFEYRFLIVDRYAPFLLMNNSRLNGGHVSDRYGFARLQEVADPADQPHFLRLARAQYAEYFDGFRPNGCGVAAVRDTLERCRAAGWRAALVLMPESSEWLGWYPAEGLRELDAVVGGLSAEFGVPVIDART